jgi:hypothetical protein
VPFQKHYKLKLGAFGPQFLSRISHFNARVPKPWCKITIVEKLHEKSLETSGPTKLEYTIIVPCQLLTLNYIIFRNV